jgi:type I restriction enzyme S subunit
MEVKPGYKLTEIGVIPEDWDTRNLTDISKKITDGDHLTPKRTSQGYYLLSARNILNGRIDVSDVDYVGVQEYQRMKQRCNPEAGDILISCSGTIGRISVVPTGLECVLVRSAALIKLNQAWADSVFIQYWLQASRAQSQISVSVNQGAQPNLFLNHIERLKCVLPPLSEQRSIASALSDIDALLVGLDQIITKKRNLKQAAMQQLLTGKRRLPGFEGKWEKTTLGEIGECIIGLTYKPENVVEHGLLVLRSSNIQNGQLVYDDNVYVNIEVPDHLVTRTGDILVCVRNGSRALIGKCAVINESAAGLTFGAFMSIYRTKYWRFIAHAFQAHDIQRQIRDNIGATINQITNKDMKAFRVLLPPGDEQNAIATVLSDMDAEIATLEERRDKTRALKQGMMQELLTGRTRLG